jgi:hypothetical protein
MQQAVSNTKRTHSLLQVTKTAWFYSFFLRNISNDVECEVVTVFAFAIYHEVSRVNLNLCHFSVHSY